jgi:hypothetical protein
MRIPDLDTLCRMSFIHYCGCFQKQRYCLDSPEHPRVEFHGAVQIQELPLLPKDDVHYYLADLKLKRFPQLLMAYMLQRKQRFTQKLACRTSQNQRLPQSVMGDKPFMLQDLSQVRSFGAACRNDPAVF